MIPLFQLLKGGDLASRMNTERKAQRGVNSTKMGFFFQVNSQLALEISFSFIILDSGKLYLLSAKCLSNLAINFQVMCK